MSLARGGVPRSADRAAAEALHVAVLHYDADFDSIASVTGQRCRWVVPADSAPYIQHRSDDARSGS